MTTGQSRLITGAVILIVLVAALYLFTRTPVSQVAMATTYEECIAAGYPSQGTNPDTCQLPDGTVLTSQTSVATSTPTSVATTSTTTASTTQTMEIQVTSLSTNQVVSSPLTIAGTARGPWYFEGSFPVTLLDGNGKIIAQAPAKATSDWMVSTLVPFSVTLTFTKPATATGTLIFKNDNPSGLPQNAKSMSFPVRF